MGPKKYFFFLLFGFVLPLVSCVEMSKDTGLENGPDEQLRSGLSGSPEKPAVLDPFKKYTLVMAGDECRYFVMKVPSGWYWKIYLTTVNREVGREGKLTAGIGQYQVPWVKLPDADLFKTFHLRHEGVQGVLGVGNNAQTRPAMMSLCQEGAPLKVTIESQVSSATGLLGPNKKPMNE